MRNSGWVEIPPPAGSGAENAWGLVGFDGAMVHGWVQAQSADGTTVMGYDSVSLDSLEAEMAKATGPNGEVGFFGIGKALKKMVRKVGKSKVLRGAFRMADKALKNPYFKAGMMAIPGGGSVVAAHTAYHMARKAIRGNPLARKFIGSAMRGMKMGSPKALRFGKLLRAGMRSFGGRGLRRYSRGRPSYGQRLCPVGCVPRSRYGGRAYARGDAPYTELGAEDIAVLSFDEIEADIVGQDEILELEAALSAGVGQWPDTSILSGDGTEILLGAERGPADTAEDIASLVAVISDGKAPTAGMHLEEPLNVIAGAERLRMAREGFVKVNAEWGPGAPPAAGDWDIGYDSGTVQEPFGAPAMHDGPTAEAGAAWDGTKWVAKRLMLQPMKPGQPTARSLLLRGREAQRKRFLAA